MASAEEPTFTITAEQFDKSVFYGRTAPGEARLYVSSILNQEIRTVDAQYSLTAEQVTKLKAAGERDIDDWLEQVAAARSEYAGKSLTQTQQAKMRMVLDDLRLAPQTLFQRVKSDFEKALSETPNNQERQRCAAQLQAAREMALQAPILIRAADLVFLDAVDAQGERRIVINALQFEKAAFDGQSSERHARQQFDAALDKELTPLISACTFSEAQQRKLRLAGLGDIHAWFDRVAEIREKYTTAPIDQRQLGEYQAKMNSLLIAKQVGLFGDNSLFRKTLAGALTAEQRDQYAAFERERRTSLIDAFVRSWEQKPIGIKLDDPQRKKLVALFVDKPGTPQSWGPYAHWIGLLQIDEYARDVEPLLENWQWDLLQKQVLQAKRVEPQLRSMGVWPLKPAAKDAPEE